MNKLEHAARSLDRLQQRTPGLGFGVAVAKKFGDDRGGPLAALLTYYGFLSLFPLLLILTTVLGFVGNRAVSRSVIGTTLDQFPVFGDQIGKDAAHPIQGSGVALVIGLVVLLYGALGVAQAAQHAMAEVWNIRGSERPGFFPRLGRALVFLVCLGAGVAATAALSSLTTAGGSAAPSRILAGVAGLALNVVLMLAVFRLLTPKMIPIRSLVPGSLAGGVGYTALLWLGTALVQHQLRHAEALYGQFGLVLGMLGWLFLVSQLILYSAELNVVLAERLWPRSIVQPPLTRADRRVLENIARQAERLPEERVGVTFTEQDGHVCHEATPGREGAMQQRRVRVSSSDGADTAAELELAVTLSGDPVGEWWTARSAPDAERPPPTAAVGPVVVTLLDGEHEGARADAWARVGTPGNVIVLEGSSPFIAPTRSTKG